MASPKKIHAADPGKVTFQMKSSTGTPQIGMHFHNAYEVYLLLEGEAVYHVEHSIYPLSPHDLIITNSAEFHSPILKSKGTYGRALFQFTSSAIQDFITPDFNLLSALDKRKTGEGNKIGAAFVREYGIDKLFERAIGYQASRLPESEIMLRLILVEILVQINRFFDSNATRTIPESEKKPKISNILNYINENITENITLDALEERFFTSKYHICHIFKEATGFSPGEYVAYKRIILAKELILSGTPLLEVCHMSGFNDYSNFYKAFKKFTGRSPKTFRALI